MEKGMVQVEVFWVMTPYSDVEVGGSMDLRNVGILQENYTESQRRRPRLESLPPWKPQISHKVTRMGCRWVS